MTDEERDIITSFVARVSGAARPAPTAGSVPATIPTLPPIDQDADRLIADLFQRYPEARYRLTQTAFVQDHALTEAQARITQLQAQLDQARAAPAQSTPQPATGGGFFHNIFGGGQPAPPPQPQQYQPYPAQPAPAYAPPPQYAPQPAYAQPPQGLFQRGGSGFLGSALTTAAGVAGGMVAGNALMNLFEGPRGGFGGGGFGGGFGGGGMEPGYAQPGPWDSPQQDAQSTGSAWDNATENSQPAGWDQGSPDQGNTDQGNTGQGGSWDQGGGNDTSGNDGGGWDQGGNNTTGSF